jgi:hypothetical protein
VSQAATRVKVELRCATGKPRREALGFGLLQQLLASPIV